ncbi:MAG: hypothetical protein H8E15_05915 [Planctomycetes bacterium]|nr:hypothetical protein [Planctomycetota bacterium]
MLQDHHLQTTLFASRNNRTRLFGAFLAVLCCGFGYTANSPAQESGLFAQGQRLPDLELPTIDGSRRINLAELPSKKLLLIQFASW